MYLDPQNDDLKTSDQIWFNEYTLFKVNWDVQMLNWDVKFIISLYIYILMKEKNHSFLLHILIPVILALIQKFRTFDMQIWRIFDYMCIKLTIFQVIYCILIISTTK